MPMSPTGSPRAEESLAGAIEIGPEPPAGRPMVLEVIRP